MQLRASGQAENFVQSGIKVGPGFQVQAMVEDHAQVREIGQQTVRLVGFVPADQDVDDDVLLQRRFPERSEPG